MDAHNPLFTKRAEQDIFDIVDYMAKNSPQMAKSFIMAISDMCELLATQPDMGSERIFSTQIGRLRIFPVGKFQKYLIFYRRKDRTIEIIRVLHGAQNTPSIMDAA